MDDSELVAAADRGDQHARAAIYDRYTDRIHDFAYATLRDRTEAVEVVQETFGVGFERLHQLGEPGRLGPWLFAIAHRAALGRAAGRTGPDTHPDLTEVVPAVPPTAGVAAPLPAGAAAPPAAPPPTRAAARPASQPEDRARHELPEFVWQASGALSGQERALLDLDVRQGLSDRDLADAVGLSRARLGVTLTRMRAQFERSVGALLVALSGRRDCPRLADILTGWDEVVTPELGTRITSHVDDCETCNSRRRLVLNPLEVLATVAPTPAPAFLRQVVLGRSDRAAGSGPVAAGWIFDADGFPYQGGDRQSEPAGAVAATMVTPAAAWERPADVTRVTPYRAPTAAVPPAASAPPADRFVTPGAGPAGLGDRRGLVIGAVAGVIILVGGVVALVAGRGHGGGAQVAITVATTAAPPTTIAPTTAAPTTAGPSTTGPSTTGPPAPTTVPPGHFVVGAKRLDFGATGVAQSLVLRNDGAGPLTFTATAPVTALSIAPSGGAIEPGANTTLTVTLDRTGAPPGPLSTTVAVSSGAGTAIVAVAAEIDPGPSISGPVASPDTVRPTTCLLGSAATRSTVTAQIAAPVPLDKDGARLHSQPPAGTDTAMNLNGPTATGTLGPYPTAPAGGTIEWWITATDTQGLTASGPHHFLTVNC